MASKIVGNRQIMNILFLLLSIIRTSICRTATATTATTIKKKLRHHHHHRRTDLEINDNYDLCWAQAHKQVHLPECDAFTYELKKDRAPAHCQQLLVIYEQNRDKIASNGDLNGPEYEEYSQPQYNICKTWFATYKFASPHTHSTTSTTVVLKTSAPSMVPSVAPSNVYPEWCKKLDFEYYSYDDPYYDLCNEWYDRYGSIPKQVEELDPFNQPDKCLKKGAHRLDICQEWNELYQHLPIRPRKCNGISDFFDAEYSDKHYDDCRTWYQKVVSMLETQSPSTSPTQIVMNKQIISNDNLLPIDIGIVFTPNSPTISPTITRTKNPTPVPTKAPTKSPTKAPTAVLTNEPTTKKHSTNVALPYFKITLTFDPSTTGTVNNSKLFSLLRLYLQSYYRNAFTDPAVTYVALTWTSTSDTVVVDSKTEREFSGALVFDTGDLQSIPSRSVLIDTTLSAFAGVEFLNILSNSNDDILSKATDITVKESNNSESTLLNDQQISASSSGSDDSMTGGLVAGAFACAIVGVAGAFLLKRYRAKQRSQLYRDEGRDVLNGEMRDTTFEMEDNASSDGGRYLSPMDNRVIIDLSDGFV